MTGSDHDKLSLIAPFSADLGALIELLVVATEMARMPKDLRQSTRSHYVFLSK